MQARAPRFAGLAQRDQEDLDFQKQEDKRNKSAAGRSGVASGVVFVLHMASDVF